MSYSKYSDIVTLRQSSMAYNIQNEGREDWKMFIANDQFNEVLNNTVKSVFNNDMDNHKPFWIYGTYGTGKSHAGAVIKHLLCDPLSEIENYVQEEYKDEKHKNLRHNLLQLRTQKRLFPVMLYGTESISHTGDMSLVIQRRVLKALKEAGISDLHIKTDFDNYAEHINNNQIIWEHFIAANPQLPQSLNKLVKDLKSGDIGVLNHVKEALRNRQMDIRINNTQMVHWLFEVQDKLAEQSDYDGLLIIWDEFTDLMKLPIGESLLVVFQEIVEKMMQPQNNSYFLLISHSSALDSLKPEEQNKTKGRYHYMQYNMEPVSAFKIMSRKFKIVEDEQGDIAYQSIREKVYAPQSELLDYYVEIADSNKSDETYQDLKNLFPLHPSTAHLATYFAREAGSSSRSVFEFLGNNDAVKEFLNSEEHFIHQDLITADYLWDYVLDTFTSDIVRFGAVTERFNSHRLKIEDRGKDYSAVFKGILLLNALNNIAHRPSVTPSQENIKKLFVGTNVEENLINILDYFNESGIIQRSPSGDFSIQFTALPAKEIEETKERLTLTQFKFTSQVLNFGGAARKSFDLWLKGVCREKEYKLYSIESNEFTLLNMIANGRKSTKSYELFIAFLLGRNHDELKQLKEIADRASQEERFRDVIFIVSESVFTDSNYNRFIEYQANAACAQTHGFADQQQAHSKSASEMVEKWMNDVRRSNFTYYLQNIQDQNTTTKLASTINACMAPLVFEHGIESLDIIRSQSHTYWKKAAAKAVVNNVLSYNTKEEITQACSGANKHISLLLQNSVDENLKWLPGMNNKHPLFLVCEFIDKRFKNTDKNSSFNLGEKLIDLTKPPYGLYQSVAGMGMVAFAMRKYIKLIFDTNGKPRDKQHIVEDIVELFKAWESEKTSGKLNFQFETQESRNLSEGLIQLFNLRKLNAYKDASSLTDARWAITGGDGYCAEKGFPLWSLKYADPNVEEGVRSLIDNILQLCEEVGTRNPRLMGDVLDGIKNHKFTVYNILNNPECFKIGFVNFLKSHPDVEIEEGEMEGVLSSIKEKLQREVGKWKEEEVTMALYKWKVGQATKSYPIPEIEPNNVPNEPNERPYKTLSCEQKTKTKEKITQIEDIDLARKILVEVCELGDEAVIQIINRYV